MELKLKMKSQLIKVLVLGDANVGKTALMQRYTTSQFSNDYKPTIGVDFMKKDIKVNNNVFTLQIWDTAGQERFHCLNVSFYRGADCCVLVYDVTDAISFSSLDSWRNDFLIHTSPSPKVPFILLGNKIDLEDKRVITSSEAEEWCKLKGDVHYIETSAKTGVNVDLAFKKVAEETAEKVDFSNQFMTPPLNLRYGNQKENSTSWCTI